MGQGHCCGLSWVPPKFTPEARPPMWPQVERVFGERMGPNQQAGCPAGQTPGCTHSKGCVRVWRASFRLSVRKPRRAASGKHQRPRPDCRLPAPPSREGPSLRSCPQAAAAPWGRPPRRPHPTVSPRGPRVRPPATVHHQGRRGDFTERNPRPCGDPVVEGTSALTLGARAKSAGSRGSRGNVHPLRHRQHPPRCVRVCLGVPGCDRSRMKGGRRKSGSGTLHQPHSLGVRRGTEAQHSNPRVLLPLPPACSEAVAPNSRQRHPSKATTRAPPPTVTQ